MRHRFFLLPTGTWALLESADPTLLSDGTILLDMHEMNPGKRMRMLRGGSWFAMTEADVDRIARACGVPDGG